MSQPAKGVNWHFIAATTLAFALFLVGLHQAPVPTVDGAVRASMARFVARTGQLWPLMYQGEVLIDHPPLQVWSIAAAFKALGVNDFAANLMPRVFAFLAVVLTAACARAAGLSRGSALLAVVMLCLTRDFVLSSVRGYIEPLLETCIYGGLWCALRYRKRPSELWAFAAGALVWLAAFAKGPVALWPLAFFALLLWLPMGRDTLTAPVRLRGIFAYFFAFAVGAGTWAAWNQKNGYWPFWHRYLFEQVLGSALTGRNGAQGFEPSYFVRILLKTYWPWLPLLGWSLAQATRHRGSNAIFALLGLGFVAGFSLVKWKFWYYIAPAYPAFALCMASALHPFVWNWLEHPLFPKSLAAGAMIWIALGSTCPLRLYRERVPEVMAFKDTIANSTIPGPVWFVDDPMDHNMIGTSGEWYFDRVVEKVTDISNWQTRLRGPAWIITGAESWKSCHQTWCQRSILIQSAGKSALVYYEGR